MPERHSSYVLHGRASTRGFPGLPVRGRIGWANPSEAGDACCAGGNAVKAGKREAFAPTVGAGPGLPGRMAERLVGRDMSERMVERPSECMAERMAERMVDRMADQPSQRMAERMVEGPVGRDMPGS